MDSVTNRYSYRRYIQRANKIDVYETKGGLFDTGARTTDKLLYTITLQSKEIADNLMADLYYGEYDGG